MYNTIIYFGINFLFRYNIFFRFWNFLFSFFVYFCFINCFFCLLTFFKNVFHPCIIVILYIIPYKNLPILISNYSFLGKNINRAKLQRLSKLPKCMDNVHDYLDMDEVISMKKENLVIFNDISYNVIIFSCESNLKFVCIVETILVDGTFNYCTKFFQQMFTVIDF